MNSETNDSTTFILFESPLSYFPIIANFPHREAADFSGGSWRPGSNPAAAFERRGACSHVAYSLELRAAA